MSKEKDVSRKNKMLLKKLRSSYRVSLINDSTFEEKLSIKLSPMNVMLLGGSAFLLLGFAFISLVVFTPLKEYIPGYTDNEFRKNALHSAILADSLKEELRIKATYVDNLMRILNDEPILDLGQNSTDSSTAKKAVIEIDEQALQISQRDSALRARIDGEEKYTVAFNNNGNIEVNSGSSELSDMYMFPPVLGTVTEVYDPAIKHLGIDIVAPVNETIKAALDGSVIASTWTVDGGNMIQIQHHNNIVTVYKHNSVLLKKVGDVVKAGDSIAIIGNSGELTTGPHLHFEIWKSGRAVDPQKYILFNSGKL
jgi:murein DD-endopeptidase MepM/ murein hydrolase activator NlpD